MSPLILQLRTCSFSLAEEATFSYDIHNDNNIIESKRNVTLFWMSYLYISLNECQELPERAAEHLILIVRTVSLPLVGPAGPVSVAWTFPQ